MAINFPNNPTINQQFTDASSVVWQCTMAVTNSDPDDAWARLGADEIPVSLNRIQNPALDPVPNWTGRVLTGSELTAINIIGANPVATLWPDGSVTGSSDNGNFTKWPNGELECYGEDVQSITTSTGNGSVFVGFGADVQYPLALVGYTGSLSVFPIGPNVVSADVSTTDIFKFRVNITGALSTDSMTSVKWLLRGRWK